MFKLLQHSLLAAVLSVTAGACFAQIQISEIHYDNTGTDTGEAIELTSNTQDVLDGWQIVLYNGRNGAVYNTVDLSGQMMAVAGCDNFVHVESFAANGLQNGSPDGIALVNNGVVETFISYEGELTATDGPASGMTSVDVGMSEASSTEVGFSLQLDGDAWQLPKPNTFGQCSGGGVIDPNPTMMFISEVQGASDTVTTTNPVTVSAIVTATYLGSSQLNGFYIQEEDADQDANPLTSEGIFVYCPSCTTVQVGDAVTVTGTPNDFFDNSQITADTVTVLSQGNVLPSVTVLSLPIAYSAADVAAATAEVNAVYEAVEGMLVQVAEPLTVTETYNLSRYGEILLSANGRLRQFTDANTPDANGFAWYAVARLARSFLLDDGSTKQNPEPVPYPIPGLSASNGLRAGDEIHALTGIVSFGFSAWRLQPVWGHYPYEFVGTNPRPGSPMPTDDIRIASFNVLNLFTTLDENTNLCGPSLLGCRGADNPAEFDRQLEKLTGALCAMDADVIGLMELENNPVTLDALTHAVNLECGGYTPIVTGAIGGDAITVGMMYRPGKVRAVGNVAVLDTPEFLNPNQHSVDKNRPAVAQSFKGATSGEVFTVVVNHFKSKGSNCAEGLDPNDDDTTTGQGNCNGTRTQASIAQLNWLATNPTGVVTDHILVMGDLNAYRKEAPITAFTSAGYTDLVDAFNGADAYGFVFSGAWGYLDHALATPSLVPFVTDVSDWHINADEIRVLDYNGEFKPSNFLADIYTSDVYRASDHDPLLIDIAFAVSSLSITDILTQFNASLSGGDIVGVGRNSKLKTIRANVLKWVLISASTYEKRGQVKRACLLLRVANRRSNDVKPKSWVAGAGVADFNAQVNSYIAENCQ